MNKKQRAQAITEALRLLYPQAECALLFGGDPYKLLIMGILSAQCTDKRVNAVSPALFERFPDAAAMAKGDIGEIEELIRTCGLYKTKAKNIKAACEKIVSQYNSKVPDNMEDLLSLPGVGRKIANLMLGDVFGKPAIVTDTHCIRLAARMGLTKKGEKNPLRTERELCALIEKKEQADFCHRMVLLGREYCIARSPKCGECPLNEACKRAL